ncbi:MAG TPA: substrate-binding domain-containing protein [Candidatus Methylomirabilis sp.]|nr:substrate-binding domain-containing protein [Candidatus Methylomirabilis sp.]
MKKLRFLVSLITKENDFQLEQAASAEAAARDVDVEIEIVYADGDSITQSTQILKSIQSHATLRPNGIIFEPAGGTGLPQVAKAAGTAGIGWGLLNREADYIGDLRQNFKIPAFQVMSDHRETGRIQATQLNVLLPQGGAVLYIIGPAETATVQERKAGFEAACSENLHCTVLRGKWTEESSLRSVAAWLKLGVSQKLNIGAIVSQNDAMAIGARKAFQQVSDPKERERWLSLPFLGCDGLPKTGQAWVRSGLLAATVISPPMAGRAVQLMAQALRSGVNPPETTLTTLESYPPIAKLSKLEPAATR